MVNTVDLQANGKLLLSGEYLVLAGARALSFPVRFGQSLKITPLNIPSLEWNCYDSSGCWFTEKFDLPGFEFPSQPNSVAEFCKKILSEVKDLNPAFLSNEKGYTLDFQLNYPREWGLGSSSTLIWLMAKFAGVDAFQLYRKLSKGSGYDLACASRKEAFFYTLKNNNPIIENATIGKAIQQHSCFAYLEKKQDSAIEIDRFLQLTASIHKEIDQVSLLGTAISTEDDAFQLSTLIQKHESILSGILSKEPLSIQFPGFPGAIKSLGAWGGDFAMFVSHYPQYKIKEIIKEFGLKTIFTFDELKIIQ